MFFSKLLLGGGGGDFWSSSRELFAEQKSHPTLETMVPACGQFWVSQGHSNLKDHIFCKNPSLIFSTPTTEKWGVLLYLHQTSSNKSFSQSLSEPDSMSLISTYGQCFVEEWHASCWCLGCFTLDLPRTYNRNWFCRNALMGLMFGTDELWLFFQKNIEKIHHVFLHPSSCWSRFCTDKLGTKALNPRKNILSSQELLTWLLLHWNCHELSAETLHMIKTFQKRQKIQQLDHSIGSHHDFLCFFAPPCPPPTPEPAHQFRWLLELGRLATSFLQFEAISTVDADSVRIQWFHVSCMDLVGISVLSL